MGSQLGRLTLLVCALPAVLAGCASDEVGTAEVKAIQAEAKSAVPADLKKVPPDLASKGFQSMGGQGAKKTPPAKP